MTNSNAPRTSTPSGAHSLIGASSMSRLIKCPGSFRLSQQVKTPTGGGSSIYAATGTVAHALGEQAIALGTEPAAEIGTTVDVDGYEITVDAGMAAGVAVYVAEVQHRSLGATWTAQEERLCLDPYWPADAQPPVSAFGTGDTLIYNEHSQHLTVIDYKNGAGVFVDVIDNPQLLYYGAGAMLVVPGPVLTVDLVIVQPNVRGKEKVRVFPVTGLDVIMWVDDVLKPAVAKVVTPDAPLSVGDHCRFCPARATCPAQATIRQELARRDFGPVGAPVVLSPAEVGKVLTDWELVGVHIDALREQAQEEIKTGAGVSGWTLEPSRPVRGWSTGGMTLTTKLIEAGFGEEAPNVFAPTVARTPSQLEKVLSPAAWAVVQPYVESKSSGVRLVPRASDTGSASTRSAARDDFA